MNWLELKIIPVVQVLIAALLIKWIDTTFPTYNFAFEYSALLAAVILFIAVIIGVYAVINFKQHKTTVNPVKIEQASTVVDSGIFAYSRNPMYLAMLLALLAGVVYSENVLTLISVVAFFGYITRFQIIPEERMLKKLFGQNYVDYCQKVRRWL